MGKQCIFRVVRVTLTTLLWIIFLLQHTHKCFLIFYIMSTPVAWSHVTIMTLLQEQVFKHNASIVATYPCSSMWERSSLPPSIVLHSFAVISARPTSSIRQQFCSSKPLLSSLAPHVHHNSPPPVEVGCRDVIIFAAASRFSQLKSVEPNHEMQMTAINPVMISRRRRSKVPERVA